MKQVTDSSQLLAHQVELSGEVGATLHIEPNDNPRAGEPAVTWFALVTEGGRPVPLAACDCDLAVYALPRQPGDAPVDEPDLRPLSAEGYQAIPSAEINFPAVGEYELLLTGSATGDPEFEPFELGFNVLVARGAQGETPSAGTAATAEAETTETAAPTESVAVSPKVVGVEPGPSALIIVASILALGVVIGSLAYLLLRKKTN